MKATADLVDINNKKGLPRYYKFNQFYRWSTLLIGLAVLLYAFWIIFFKLGEDSPRFFKFVPFILIFLAANSMMRNLFSLNSVHFTKEKIQFKFLARKSMQITWSEIYKINYGDRKQRAVLIYYRSGGEDCKFLMQIAFPNMLEIINSIAEMCENVEYDDFITSILISEKEKEQHSTKN